MLSLHSLFNFDKILNNEPWLSGVYMKRLHYRRLGRVIQARREVKQAKAYWYLGTGTTPLIFLSLWS
jgi:hypothetical protein